MTAEAIRHKLRADALEIFNAGVAAVQPEYALRQHVQREGSLLTIGENEFILRPGRLFVLAIGKAAAPMAKTLEDILGPYLTAGIAVTKYDHDHGFRSQKIRLIEAGHPIPDANSVAAAQAVKNMALQAGAGDLVLVAISGGGSALLTLPAADLTLEDKQRTTEILLRAGATIQEINTVRKHLSAIKGGQLAAALAPARHCSLILSDVIGDPLEFIASGPTVPDSTTFADAWRIIENYALCDALPERVQQHLQSGISGTIGETPKAEDLLFEYGIQRIIGSNWQAAGAAREKAEGLGYTTLILTTALQGEAREIGELFPALAHDILVHHAPVAPPACVICGGETTVTVRGNGRGGRNQEMALAVLPGLADRRVSVFLSAGTDGTDGPTDAAGGIVDDTSLFRATTANLNWQHALADNDAYPFFDRLGDLIKTGPTGTNVMDLQILLVALC